MFLIHMSIKHDRSHLLMPLTNHKFKKYKNIQNIQFSKYQKF